MTPLKAGTIRVAQAGKCYTKYEDTPTLAYGLLHAFKHGRRSKLWAVSDVDMDISPGESVGVIGKNGSGKSTLLQMLCGVTGPTTGSVRVAGRVAPLISVGVGFHPELTGRENIFVNGTILGLTRREIAAKLDEIVAFSEIESFIDTPVKFYSSGMFVRLGFSVAAHVDPDVLLLDEVLAVGDLGFQVKCYRHMDTLRQRGCTVVIVSHNMSALEQHCSRGVVLSGGRKVFEGPIGDAIGEYHAATASDTDGLGQSDGQIPMDRDAVEVLSVETVNSRGAPATRFDAGDAMAVRVELRALRRLNAPFVTVGLLSADGVVVYREGNIFSPFPAMEAGERATLNAGLTLKLATGAYTVECVLGRGNQDSREVSKVAAGMATLAPPYRLPVYVKGRATAHGLADLGAVFDWA